MNANVTAAARVDTRPLLSEPDSRHARIVEHYGLVHAIVSRMARRYPAHIDTDDLVDAGTLGLIDAVDRYDASRGVPFKAYAEIRIRGAVVDALRASDWAPRAVRRVGARIEETRQALRRRHGREPEASEIAAELGLAVETFVSQCARATPLHLVSLDAPATDDGNTRFVDALADEAPTPYDRCLAADLGRAAIRAVDALPEREREVVRLYYEADLSLKEIGARLGLSESRVCQIHGCAMKRLQRILKPTLED